MDYNRFTLEGRLTEDPTEQVVGSSNKHIVKFCVAQNRQYSASGTYFFECVAWEPVSSFAARFRKGEAVHIEGVVEVKDWTDRNGYKRKMWEVNVRECWWAGKKTDNERVTRQRDLNVDPDTQTETEEPQYEEVDDSDLPF